MKIKHVCKTLCMRSRTGPWCKVSVRRTTGYKVFTIIKSTEKTLSVSGIEPETLSLQSYALTANAARLVCKKRKSDHISPLLAQFHWLPLVKRILYKLDTICFETLNDSAPDYLTTLLHVYRPS